MANIEIINSHQAARLLGYPPRLLFIAQLGGGGPDYVFYQGQICYLRSVIEEFKERRIPPDLLCMGPKFPKELSRYGQDDTGLWRYRHSLDDARRAKLIRYFSGVPCERGHVVERYAKNDQCTACAEENRLRRMHRTPRSAATKIEEATFHI